MSNDEITINKEISEIDIIDNDHNESDDIDIENINNKKIVLSLLAIIIDNNLVFENEKATNDLLDLIVSYKLLNSDE